jgi:protein-disulfide isomerase
MNRGRFHPLLGVAALALAGCGDGGGNRAEAESAAPLAQIKAPNGDWTQTVAETPEGGYRMGNPDAPVKLIEYGSLTCHVCAEFSEAGSEPLRERYVKSGQLSWEFRPYLLFPTDPGISMLLKCQGPGPFFRLTDQLYADQRNWASKLQQLSPAEQERLQAMAPQERAAALVRATGVDQFFRQRGMPQARIDACLADAEALQQLAALTERGNREGVTGTPTFFIDGSVAQGAASWEALEPRLRAALR